MFYLPEAHTDFLLAVIAEELGFVGVLVVIVLFGLLIQRAFAIGRQAVALDRLYYLASSRGFARQLTGSYQAGFLIFAALAVFALVGLTAVKTRWRTTWGAAHLTSAKI